MSSENTTHKSADGPGGDPLYQSETHNSRRRFLKKAGAGLGVALGATSLPRQSMAAGSSGYYIAQFYVTTS